MAYLEARAGIARAGVTYGGWAAPRWTITVAGTTRTTDILHQGFTIRRGINSPVATMRFRAVGWVPATGSRVIVQYSTPNEWLFSGTLVRRTYRLQYGLTAIYDCEVVSDAWLLDLRRPYGVMSGRGLRPALEWLRANWAEDFRIGSVPSSLADVPDASFAGDRRPSEIISGWVAQNANTYWRIRPDRTIDVFTAATLPDGNGLTIINGTVIGEFIEQADLAQIVTRVTALGPATVTTAAVSAGATSVPVADCSVFSGDGGFAVVAGGLTNYIARSAASGAGTLTLDTAFGVDVPAAAPIAFASIQTDLDAVSDLSTLLDGNGTAEQWLVDAGTTPAAVVKQAIAFLGSANEETSTIRYRTTERRVAPGQAVIVNITVPVTLAKTYVVTEVETVVRAGRDTATRADLWHTVTAVQYDLNIWSRMFYSTPPTAAQPYTGPLTPPGFLSGVRH
jgi:hypothetical protein